MNELQESDSVYLVRATRQTDAVVGSVAVVHYGGVHDVVNVYLVSLSSHVSSCLVGFVEGSPDVDFDVVADVSPVAAAIAAVSCVDSPDVG